MINTSIEETLPLAKAARKHASARGEGSVHPATLHRWRQPGIGGITLECIKVGGVWHTSREALQRFFERLTAARDAQDVPLAGPPARRMAEPGCRQARVEAELDAALGGRRSR